jgi:hypothetical protein
MQKINIVVVLLFSIIISCKDSLDHKDLKFIDKK